MLQIHLFFLMPSTTIQLTVLHAIRALFVIALAPFPVFLFVACRSAYCTWAWRACFNEDADDLLDLLVGQSLFHFFYRLHRVYTGGKVASEYEGQNKKTEN